MPFSKLLICLAVLALVACKDNTPEVELLEIGFASGLDSILDPATDTLTEGGVLSPTTHLRAAQTNRFMLAGVHLVEDGTPEFNQNVDFYLYDRARTQQVKDRWDQKYVLSASGTWTDIDPSMVVFEWMPINDVTDMATLTGLTNRTGDIIRYSVTLRDTDRFADLTATLKEQLGDPTPAANAPFEAWYWVLEDRIVSVAPNAEQVVIQSLTQAVDGCFSIPNIGRIDLGGCDFDAAFAENPYVWLLPKMPR